MTRDEMRERLIVHLRAELKREEAAHGAGAWILAAIGFAVGRATPVPWWLWVALAVLGVIGAWQRHDRVGADG